MIAIVVELEDSFEDDYPTDPHACSVKDGLDGVLNAVEEFNRTLNPFADVTPTDGDQGKENDRYEIDYERQPPRDDEISGSPEQPGFDIVENVTSVLGRILLVPIKVKEDRCGNEQASKEHRSDERRKEKGDNSDIGCLSTGRTSITGVG